MKTVIVVHDGAWAIPDMLAEASVAGVKNGDTVLKNGGSAIDAVEKAVRCLEDDPTFDAGHGAVLNTEGEVELDSIIMDGETLATGAVASVRNIANPSLARAVKEKTDHVMLTDRGASMFADRIGIPVADDLMTELEHKDWEQSNSYPVGVKKFFNTQWEISHRQRLGGVIVLSPTGDWTTSFTTTCMAWASIKEDALHYGLNPKEDFTEMLK